MLRKYIQMSDPENLIKSGATKSYFSMDLLWYIYWIKVYPMNGPISGLDPTKKSG